ncbi:MULTISPECIES: restriction endonuclease subunit S [Rahnella]|uniref:Restriction endonuclease subunit S n=1 Tax=Rahnella laticis TaxID=2787622 RepID=A0ABS0EBV1_9GAMM|nr:MULTISPECIES: restriction endonuclease subunit S [Rahnella]MBF7980774.1 restriction endonuclease subunit S [Rahnella laticis]MBF8000865.1 restriction endonuclease subunit S [Rahnella sp. LAC-M12]
MSKVPAGWELLTIGHIADTVMGFAFKSSDFVQTGTPLLRMGNLYQNEFNLNRNPVFLPEKFKDQYPRFIVKSGDLVMSMTGTMGKQDYGFTVKIPVGSKVALLNQRVLKFISKKNNNSEFLLNVLRSDLTLSLLYSLPGGTKQANLSAKQIQELPVLVPPIPEQTKIAQILSTWDKAITTTEQLIGNSQQQKKSLMQSLLTGKKRLPGFEGEWFKATLGNVSKPQQWPTITSNQLTDSGFKVFGANGFIGYYSDYNHEFECVTVTCRGSTCGEVSLIPAKSYITGNSMCLDDIESLINSYRYIYYALCHRGFNDVISGSAQPQIIGAAIKKIKIALPPLQEQQKIAAVLTAADNEIELLQKKLAFLKQEKAALMQQLLTGKRRVNVETA